MRSLIIAAVLSVASVASAQVGRVEVVGPYQPGPYGSWYYAQSSYPYVGPIIATPYYGPVYGGGVYSDFETARELRLLRWSIEDGRHQRRWRGR